MNNSSFGDKMSSVFTDMDSILRNYTSEQTNKQCFANLLIGIHMMKFHAESLLSLYGIRYPQRDAELKDDNGTAKDLKTHHLFTERKVIV